MRDVVPLDRILLETDAPFMAPQSQRGKVRVCMCISFFFCLFYSLFTLICLFLFLFYEFAFLIT